MTATLYNKTSDAAPAMSLSGLPLTVVQAKIIYLVGKDKLAEAVALLLRNNTATDPANDAVIIQRGIAQIERERRMGTLDFETSFLKRNQLGLAILELAQQE